MPPTNKGVTNEHFINGKYRNEIFHRGGSWAYNFSRKFKSSHSNYNVESWNLYKPQHSNFSEIHKVREDNVIFKQIPCLNFSSIIFSILLLKELFNLNKKNKIIIHHQSVFTPMASMILLLFPSFIHVAQQRGGEFPPQWKYKFRKRLVYHLESLIYNYSIKNLNFVFCSSIGSFAFMKNHLGNDKVLHFKGGAFDYETYPIRSKKELRKELNLPQNKKLIIFLGQFRTWRNYDFFGKGSGKGIEMALEICNILNKADSSIQGLFVGGKEDDNRYELINKSDHIVRKYMPNSEAMKYLQASDICILPTSDKEWIPFGDIPTCLIEALSFNIPVVSKMLIHFRGTNRELQKLGFCFSKRDNLLNGTRYILRNLEKFSQTRKIVKKYYNWEITVNTTAEVYERLVI